MNDSNKLYQHLLRIQTALTAAEKIYQARMLEYEAMLLVGSEERIDAARQGVFAAEETVLDNKRLLQDAMTRNLPR